MVNETLSFERLRNADNPWSIKNPAYATEGSACFDICAATAGTEVILPCKRAVIPTGIKYKIPTGYELQVRSRSGMAAKYGVVVLNSPGTIDEDYQGELFVILHNSGNEPYHITRSQRIAQATLKKVTKCNLVENTTGALFEDETTRGEKGFGSTGS